MQTPTAPTVESALSRVPQLRPRQVRLAKGGPAAASSAYRAGRTKLGRHAWDLSVASLGVAVDHLETLDRTWPTAQPVWAHYTLMRSALETSTLARWLCEPGIRPSERMKRGVAAQLADYDERKKVEAKATQPLPQVTAVQRIQALRLAYARLQNGSLRPMPSYTTLVDDYALPIKGRAELLYRILSAAAHGKQWAMLAMGDYVAAPAQGKRQSSHLAQITVSPRIAGMLAELVVGAVELALGDAEVYGGR